MRRLVAFTLALGLGAAPAAAGPIRLGVETETPPAEPFLVRVYGHYFDFHNGRSRHWKDALIPAGGRHFVPLGPVNALINLGVSVSIHHPAYVAERQRSQRTPLLIRPVGFETFRPRSWRQVMTSGGEFANGGPEQVLGQALGHVWLFVESYLPALDASQRWQVSDAALRGQLPLLREIVEFAHRDESRERRSRWAQRQAGGDPEFARSLARRDLEQLAELREWLRRAEAWLSLAREQRAEVHRRMEQMRSVRSVGAELLSQRDLAELGAFVERQAADRAAGREPEGAIRWTNPATRISYRAQLSGQPRECTRVSLTTDLTTLVEVDLGGLTHTVVGELCRVAAGRWEYGRS
jgi:hypothetical protein